MNLSDYQGKAHATNEQKGCEMLFRKNKTYFWGNALLRASNNN
jgi:hypothetical protein